MAKNIYAQRIKGIFEGVKINRTDVISDYTALTTDCDLKVDTIVGALLLELLEPSSANDGQNYDIIAKLINVANDLTILAFSQTLLDVDTITNTAGSTWRYTMNGTPDLSGVSAGDYIKTANATNAANDGTWIVTAVDDASDYIEITNASGVAEGTDSTCTLQLAVLQDNTMVTDETRTYRADADDDVYRRIN